jgi:riboflavin transporter FmnP
MASTTSRSPIPKDLQAAIDDQMVKNASAIGGSLVTTLLQNVPSIVDTGLKYVLNMLKEIPLFNKIMSNMQGNDTNKILMLIGVLFVISLIIPFWILILLNMILTFILVMNAQRKCIS